MQLRSLARGSDGLAEVTVEDAKTVIIPIIQNPEVRKSLQPYINRLKDGKIMMRSIIRNMIEQGKWDIEDPEKRPSHIVLV